MHSPSVALHFARLVSLLVHDASRVDEQKFALRAVLATGKGRPTRLTLEDWRVVADGSVLPPNDPDLQTLAAQMIGHAVAELRLSETVTAAHLFAVARALAQEPRPGSGGRAILDALRALESPTIAAVIDAVAPAEPQPPPRPAVPPPVNGQRPPMRASGSYLAFAAVPAPTKSVPEMLADLAGVSNPEDATLHLDGIVTLLNRAADENKAHTLADALCALAAGEDARTDVPVKRAYTMALRGLRKPRIIRLIARLLASRPANMDQLLGLLGRWGQDATDALIEELTVAETVSERRTLFDALVKLKAATPSLLHMLKDKRWFVLRNAAELLGELPTSEAEAPLAKLLKHEDERVRRAAAVSLGKIATGNAFAALRTALRDESSEVRLVAATALGAWKRSTSSQSLVVALEGEEDSDVQMQIITTLGRVGTADAVERLISLAEPGGTLFKRKSPGVRLAAVEALGDAATPAALAALKDLRDDKDAAVREAATRLVRTMPAAKASATGK